MPLFRCVTDTDGKNPDEAQHRHAFTLIELLVVVAKIAILTALLLPVQPICTIIQHETGDVLVDFRTNTEGDSVFLERFDRASFAEAIPDSLLDALKVAGSSALAYPQINCEWILVKPSFFF